MAGGDTWWFDRAMALDPLQAIRDIAWQAQLRLCHRYRRLAAAGKPKVVVTTAIAREMVARGQGRKHAIRFAREGARIIGLDLCDSPSEYVKYRAATEDDLATTIERVEAEGGEILAEVGDVRDLAFQQALVARGVERFGGRLDVVIANAGICNWGKVL